MQAKAQADAGGVWRRLKNFRAPGDFPTTYVLSHK